MSLNVLTDNKYQLYLKTRQFSFHLINAQWQELSISIGRTRNKHQVELQIYL